MAQNVGILSVTIAAVDRVTAVADKIGERINRNLAPARQLGGALDRLGSATGLNRVGSGLAAMERGALNAGRSLLPLGLAGGAAGIGAAAVAWTGFGYALNKNARALQMSATDLYAFQGAAKLAGVDAQAATQGVGSLGQTIYDALGGDERKYGAFTQLGIAMRDVHGNARTGAEAIGDVADQIARLNHAPREQRHLATILGVEDMLPLLRKGRDGVRALTEAAKAHGTVSQADADRAERLYKQMSSLRLTGETFGLQVMGRLADAAEPSVTRLMNALKSDGGASANAVAERIEGVARGAGGLAAKIDGAVTSTVGWERATEIALAAMIARYTGLFGVTSKLFGLVPPAWWLRAAGLATAPAGLALGAIGLGHSQMAPLTEGQAQRHAPHLARPNDGYDEMGRPRKGPLQGAEREAREREIYAGLVKRGLSPVDAAADTATAMRESGGRLDAFNGAGGGIGANGLFQQRADRARMADGRIVSRGTLDEQLDHRMRDRAQGSQVSGRERADMSPEAQRYAPGSAARAGYAVSRGDMRHDPKLRHTPEDEARAADAERIHRRMTTPGPFAATGGTTPDLNGRVQVDIGLRGAPAGTTATARTSGIAEAAPPRFERAMPNGSLP